MSQARTEADRRRALRAWASYDWANSSFATSVQAAAAGPFFASLAAAAGIGPGQATAYWGYASSAALAVVSLSGPLLGAASDSSGRRKRFLGVFAALGVLATAAIAAVGPGQWMTVAGLYVLASLGFGGANVFYESFLPHLCRPGEIDRVSSRGFALGYAGGGLLLAVHALWLADPSRFAMPSLDAAVRLVFVSAAAWWALFSIPFFLRVPEPSWSGRPTGGSTTVEAFRRLSRTLRSIRRYRELARFLLAFWVYGDGVGTVQKMAAVYGAELGFELPEMVAALLISQIAGVPFTLLFGRLASRFGAKNMLQAGLGIYVLISLGGFLMSTITHFYLLALLVGMVQGGVQSLSRSLFASMTPRAKSAEFFGFYSASQRFAGIFGPLAFGLSGQLFGSGRAGIASLVAFFVLGAWLLRQVDEKKGAQQAAREDRETNSVASDSGDAPGQGGRGRRPEQRG